MITVATWNVLHRVHAENWGEDVLKRWPDEPERIAAVTARLVGRAEQVIALQEVSGDQLASLRLALTDRTVHTLRYPRVPSPRQGLCSLRDPGEYLVLLVNGPSREVATESFEDDRGKGALAVEVAGTLIVATHVSGDQRRTRQLARLAELAATPPGHAAVLLGDFNTERATVASALGTGFVVADLPSDALPTRPPTSGSASPWIDHVVVRGAGVSGTAVESAYGLSDHNLVRATVTV
ncbi:endonuclease/exonuclease/phosphatase family protein [Streptomyces roseoverticillatus]|uniref:endonuclease/exonuclease/phosphatase family protein n=1 Tax=Streptomyces roseoverticillatus TaxID=66429 RepID=UPI001F3C8EC2|nr:endonuclease/exonuclease/phosphatase family protein [Streptomyces roseoverticillatus]MCF3105768.1 endonuclease/exonuclease/phosphatase family protein [Streptomyces roseoverticillatus]